MNILKFCLEHGVRFEIRPYKDSSGLELIMRNKDKWVKHELNFNINLIYSSVYDEMLNYHLKTMLKTLNEISKTPVKEKNHE